MSRRIGILDYGRQHFRRFCEETSLHGFFELYHAKSFVWKLVWFLVLSLTVGLSVYQTRQTIMTAIEQPTAAAVEKFNGDLQYPPLHVCYNFWLHIVDWDKAIGAGFDRDSVVYGMSSLGTVFLDTFNFTEAKLKFEFSMKRNNFTNLLQFFNAVTLDIPPGFQTAISNWTVSIPPEWSMLCYVANSDAIKQALFDTKNPANQRKIWTTFNTKYFTLNTTYLTSDEYVRNMVAIVQRQTENVISGPTTFINENFTTNPIISFIDVFTDAYTLPEDALEVVAVITANFYSWLNTKDHPCKFDEMPLTHDSCSWFCWWQEYKRQYPDRCIGVNFVNLYDKSFTYNVCIYGVQTQTELIGSDIPPDLNFDPNTSTYISCIENYCVPPCKQWIYRSTINPTSITLSLAKHLQLAKQWITIHYPSEDKVFSMKEVHSQTWETLFASIGGIVGLWLGASVMSLLQMVYLLCCSSCDEKISECNNLTKKRKVQPKITPAKTIQTDHIATEFF